MKGIAHNILNQQSRVCQCWVQLVILSNAHFLVFNQCLAIKLYQIIQFLLLTKTLPSMILFPTYVEVLFCVLFSPSSTMILSSLLNNYRYLSIPPHLHSAFWVLFPLTFSPSYLEEVKFVRHWKVVDELIFSSLHRYLLSSNLFHPNLLIDEYLYRCHLKAKFKSLLTSLNFRHFSK